MSFPPGPWRAKKYPGYSSSERWWTSPASLVDLIYSGLGLPGPLPGWQFDDCSQPTMGAGARLRTRTRAPTAKSQTRVAGTETRIATFFCHSNAISLRCTPDRVETPRHVARLLSSTPQKRTAKPNCWCSTRDHLYAGQKKTSPSLQFHRDRRYIRYIVTDSRRTAIRQRICRSSI